MDMKRLKKVLAYILTICMVMNLNIVDLFASTGVSVEFDGSDGEFTVTTSTDTWKTNYYSEYLETGTNVSDADIFISDAEYWDPSREFLGWKVYVEELVEDEEWGSYYDWVEIEGAECISTQDVLAYEIPDKNLRIEAQWAGDDSEYYSDVEFSGYGTELLFDPDENYWSETTYSYGREGTSIRDLMSEYGITLPSEPTKEGAEFEGWLEFSVTEVIDEDDCYEYVYTLVSENTYTTEAVLQKNVPDYNVTYAAKWSDIAVEDYYWSGPSAWLYVDGDDGTVTTTSESGQMDGPNMSFYAKVGRPISSTIYSMTEPDFWNEEREFIGWQIWVWQEYEGDDGDTYSDYVLVSDKLLSTEEVLAFTMPASDTEIRAVWNTDVTVYNSYILFQGYGGKFKLEYTYWNGEEDVTNINETSSWGEDFRESDETIKEQLEKYTDYMIVSDPVKDGAEFQGWMKYNVVVTETEESYSEEYVLTSKDLYSTEQVLNSKVPSDETAYVAKWSDMEYEDYFKPMYFVVLSGNGGNITVKFSGSDADSWCDWSQYSIIEEGDSLQNEIDQNGYTHVFQNGDAILKGWTVYENNSYYMDGGIGFTAEDIELDDPNALVIPWSTWEEDEGMYCEYLILEDYSVMYENISTEELYALSIASDIVAVANWFECPYTDVSEDAWYYKSVMYNYERGIMTGVGSAVATFAPGASMTREQFAVMLYRLEGSPDVTYESRFPDVPSGQWYSDAVMWASENGIVTGYSHNGCFGAGDEITREQMATMMYRYADYKELDVSQIASFDQFTDGDTVSEFAKVGMGWAVANGIISGEAGIYLNPHGVTNRAATATVFMRFIENTAAKSDTTPE